MVWSYTLISVIIVSLVSFVGVLFLSLKKEKLEHFLIYLVSFSVGAMLGDVFIHIIPTLGKKSFSVVSGIYFLFGIIIFFIIEKIIHWHHCHKAEHEHLAKPFALMNLIGDGLHNFLDGAIIAAAFMADTTLGVATVIAVVLHEIPQEIGDFGVLLYAGYSKRKALACNFLSALLAIVGGALTLILGVIVDGLTLILLAVAGGGFIYIAGTDLMPELHRECRRCRAVYQLIMIAAGIVLMWLLTLVE
ncbi:ZIP family metal transporter [Candidatus Falkowbacteria bacterium]|nr:ZIP family metal transporter [Candidatus Falkowbacteria bacterium]